MTEIQDRQQEGGEKTKSEEIIDKLWQQLPELAKKIIREHLDISDEWNEEFLKNPDDPQAHKAGWHQWGVVTHTRMFEMYHRKLVPRYLREWGLEEKIRGLGVEKIDDMTKDELIRIAILFHDLGKFSHRTFRKGDDGKYLNFFTDHEKASGRIIRSPEFSAMLRQEFGLSDAQIWYVAHCAEIHYELAKLRDESTRSNKYTLAFATSETCKKKCLQIMGQHKGFEREIGVMYLGDTLAKSDMRIAIGTDEGKIRVMIKERGIDESLMECIKQLPVNLEVIKTYLELL